MHHGTITEHDMTRKQQNEIIQQLIAELSLAGLTCRIAAICTVTSYELSKENKDREAEVWQTAAEAVLEASYKLGV